MYKHSTFSTVNAFSHPSTPLNEHSTSHTCQSVVMDASKFSIEDTPENFVTESGLSFALFDQSPTFTFLTAASGEILAVNQRVIQVTGLTRAQLLHRHWLELTVNTQPKDHQELLHQLKSSTAVENIEMNFHFKASPPVYRIGLLSAKLLESKDAYYIIFTINAINELCDFSSVYHIEGLKVASELAAGVGHEIRNPMTSVRGFLQMLGQKAELEAYRSYFTLMMDELDRANLIITEYLMLTKTKVRHKSKENLNTIITQISPLLQTSAILTNKTIILDLNPLPDLTIDGKEIRQLLINLVKNGLESMSDGGNLTISTYQEDAASVTLAIKDQGSGIPKDILPKIGTPFFTTKATGTGLGLSISHTIAKNNQGAITIDSSAAGTTFFIKFQLGEPTPDE